MHKGELELNTASTAPNFLNIRKAFKCLAELIQYSCDGPTVRSWKFKDCVKIEAVFFGTVDDSCSDGARPCV